MNKVLMGTIFIVLSALCYGFVPVFTKNAYLNGINTTTFLVLRFLVTFVILFGYIGIKRIKLNLKLKDIFYLFVLGAFCYVLISGFYAASMNYISASLAVLLMYTYPIFVSLYSIFIDKEKMSSKAFVFLGISIIGLALVVGNSLGKVNGFGVSLALLSAVAYTAYVLIGNRVIGKLDPIVVSAFVALFTFVSVGGFSIVTKGLDFNFKPIVWVHIVGIALIATALAVLFFFKGLDILGATKSSVLAMLEPLFAIIFSVILFKETFTPIQLSGGAALIIGIVGVIIYKDKVSTKKEETENFQNISIENNF